MPFAGVLIGGVDFTSLSYFVGDAEIQYGLFIQAIVDFFIIALALFVFVKVITRLQRKQDNINTNNCYHWNYHDGAYDLDTPYF